MENMTHPGRKLTSDELSKIEELFKEAALSPTKATGKPAIQKLKFIHSHLAGEIQNNLYYMLGELIAYCESASGQGRDQQHWEQAAREALIKLKKYSGPEDREGY